MAAPSSWCGDNLGGAEVLPGSPAAGHHLRPDTAAFIKRLRRYAVSSVPGAEGAAADAADDAADEARRGFRCARYTFFITHHASRPTHTQQRFNKPSRVYYPPRAKPRA